MKLGTKSLLFGVHQVVLHPILVTVAWRKLYKKFPPWRVFIAIIIHDWGYWGCKMMDNEEGENHPEWGAKVMSKLFKPNFGRRKVCVGYHDGNTCWSMSYLVLYHSRFLAKREGCDVSPLCLPDKLGVGMMPTWLWVGLGKLSGEVWEYMADKKYEEYQDSATPEGKFEKYKELCAKWVNGEEPLCPWRNNE